MYCYTIPKVNKMIIFRQIYATIKQTFYLAKPIQSKTQHHKKEITTVETLSL